MLLYVYYWCCRVDGFGAKGSSVTVETQNELLEKILKHIINKCVSVVERCMECVHSVHRVCT